MLSNNNILQKIFKVKKPIIGMLHFDYLLGGSGYKGLKSVIKRASLDIEALQTGGIDGIIIENWKEDSIGEFVQLETAISFSIVANEISKNIRVPFGINVLNNDYKVALSVAKLTGASFVELDVFVDKVRSDYKFSPIASQTPFEITVSPYEINSYAKKIGADNIPLFVMVQPKHYAVLDKGKTIETSTKQAIEGGASALIVTKETGIAPTLDLIKRVKKEAKKVPVGIGSGFGVGNARQYLELVDFAIVGTSIKVGGDNTDNPVDVERVKGLMQVANKLRKS